MIQLGVMNEMMEEVIGELEVELDGRFSSIRNNETNLGKHTFLFLITVMYLFTSLKDLFLKTFKEFYKSKKIYDVSTFLDVIIK